MKVLLNRRTGTQPLVLALCAVIVSVLCLTQSGLAKTIAEYRAEVTHLRADTEWMLNPGKQVSAGERQRITSEIIKEINDFAAQKGAIDTPGGVVEPRNEWLLEGVRQFSNAGSDSERLTALSAIRERLRAIEIKVIEFETAGEAAAKDENKQKLAEILRRPEFQKVAAAEESLLQRIGRWLTDLLKRLFPARGLAPGLVPRGPGAFGIVLQVVVYGIVIAVLGFLGYRYGPGLWRRMRRGRARESRERIILGETISPDETSTGLFGEAERLARKGELREAIRKGYIAVLYELGERRVFGLARHKTNRDYLRDVTGNVAIFRDFLGLTSNYERHWYGSQDVNASDWDEFRGGYRKILDPGSES